MNDVYKKLMHGRKTWLVKRAMRLISNRITEIMSKKGCDASNMFDEELSEGD